MELNTTVVIFSLRPNLQTLMSKRPIFTHKQTQNSQWYNIRAFFQKFWYLYKNCGEFRSEIEFCYNLNFLNNFLNWKTILLSMSHLSGNLVYIYLPLHI